MRERVWHSALWLAALILAVPADMSLAAESPIVLGYERIAQSAKAGSTDAARILLTELNCASCHAAENAGDAGPAKGAPDLSQIGKRMTPQAIGQYLTDPHAFKPGTTMPNLFHASEEHARDGAVEFLTQYLVSLGGPIKPAKLEGNAVLIERGRTLYHTVGCVACHAPEKPVQAPELPAGKTAKQRSPNELTEGKPLRSVPLGKLAVKTTVDELAAFLLEPHVARPSGRMPSLNLAPAEAHALAVYLLRDQANNPQNAQAPPARTSGVWYAYYEASVPDVAMETLDKLEARSRGQAKTISLGAIAKHRDDHFAARYTGLVTVPRDGRYVFYLRSDDGSRLYLDGKLLVNNDGYHASTEKSEAIELKAGDHPLAVTYYEIDGEEQLAVAWDGPGFAKQEIPAEALWSIGGQTMVPLESGEFVIDRQKAAMGERMFSLIGCASCHALPGQQPARKPKALAAVNPDNPAGCLGKQVARGLPQYDLDDAQRSALIAILSNKEVLGNSPDEKARLERTLAQVNCLACHVREGIGGPGPDRNPFFKMSAEADMGDEGRLPPRLTEVGGKLKPAAMDAIIFEGKLHVRPVLATRMPRFSRPALGDVVELFQKVDAPSKPKDELAFAEQAARDGRTLVGTKGLGCVNCHSVGAAKSLGMPGPDLASVHERIKPRWFSQLLHNPASKNPSTRMPGYWTDNAVAFPNLSGGTVDGQIDSIYTYLSLGRTMPLPTGLIPDSRGFELVVGDTPIIHRTFMAEVGSRAILVGYPESVSIAFDANVVRLAKAWRGRFFDAGGMWDGRGGSLLGPLGTDIINLPPGPSFAVLENDAAPWPMPKDPFDRNLGGEFRGYRLDEQDRPTFFYNLAGVHIAEKPLPSLRPGGAQLVRHFELKADGTPKNLFYQAAAGKTIEAVSPGVWRVDGTITLTIKLCTVDAKIRSVDGRQQLLLPVSFKDNSTALDVEMSW